MSAHYVEMTPSAFTALGAGAILYKAPEVTTGGSTAIDFSNSKFAGNNQLFLSVPIKSFAAGTYNWLRVSLAYQNYNVYMNVVAPNVGKLFSKNRNAYKYLDESIKKFPEGQNFTFILDELGYTNTYCKPLSFGICSIYCGVK